MRPRRPPRRSAAAATLCCPSCGAHYDTAARFCERCQLPLVIDGPQATLEEPLSAAHARQRMIKPQFTEGALVEVAHVSNQAEGEFVQQLLLEQGVPSMLRRSAGFDVPDFLAAGPRDVMVPQTGAATAREVLRDAAIGPAHDPDDPDAPNPATVRPRPVPLFAALLGALAVGAIVIWLLTLAIR